MLEKTSPIDEDKTGNHNQPDQEREKGFPVCFAVN